MEDCINHVTLLGRVDGDPKLGSAGSTPCLKFKLETIDSFKGRDGQQREKKAWNFVAVFGQKAVELQVQAGDRVMVAGSLSSSKSQDGRFFTEVNARTVIVIGSAGAAPEVAPAADGFDDIGF